MSIPPKYAVSKVVESLKSNTSRELRSKYNFSQTYWDDGGIWGVGYFVSTIGIDEKVIQAYVQSQENSDPSEQLTIEL
jgi:putative transposase